MKRLSFPFGNKPIGQPMPRKRSVKIQQLMAEDHETQVKRLQNFWSQNPTTETAPPPTQPTPVVAKPVTNTLTRRMY